MKTLSKHCQHWGKFVVTIGAVLAVLVVFLSASVWADPPVLKITSTGTNLISLTITNGVTNGIYEIYYTEFLESPDWQVAANGNSGQTNFDFDISETTSGFFKALTGNDLDGDGTLNYQDARPTDPSIGLMVVTIEIPANGANVQ